MNKTTAKLSRYTFLRRSSGLNGGIRLAELVHSAGISSLFIHRLNDEGEVVLILKRRGKPLKPAGPLVREPGVLELDRDASRLSQDLCVFEPKFSNEPTGH